MQQQKLGYVSLDQLYPTSKRRQTAIALDILRPSWTQCVVMLASQRLHRYCLLCVCGTFCRKQQYFVVLIPTMLSTACCYGHHCSDCKGISRRRKVPQFHFTLYPWPGTEKRSGT